MTVDHLTQVVLAAQAAGMSYGQYVAMMYERNGYRPSRVLQVEEEPAAENEFSERRCVICGGPIREGAREGIKACSAACSYALTKQRSRERYQREAKFHPDGPRKCEYCGEGFIPNRRAQRFCRERCRNAYRRASMNGEVCDPGRYPGMKDRNYGIGTCIICGETFLKRSHKQNVCSDKCRRERDARRRKERRNAESY